MKYITGYFTNYAMLTAIILGSIIMTVWWLKFSNKLNMKWYVAPLLSIGHFVLGAIALRIWGSLEVALGFDANATMKLFGGLFLLPPVYYLGAKITKRNVALVMDIAAVCCMIGFIGRFSCLVAGCCQGIPIFPNSSVRWPLNGIEMVFCTAFVLFFWQRVYCRKNAGLVCPIMGISYGLLRFVLEWFREEYTTVGIFHLAHIWSLLAIAIGAIAMYFIKKNSKPRSKQKICKKEVIK